MATSTSNMIPNASIISSSPLSVVVLLPDSMAGPGAALKAIPPPFVQRMSGSIVPNLRESYSMTMTKGGDDVDDMVVQSRRLSLAPGLGAGLRRTSLESSPPAKSGSSTPGVARSAPPAPPLQPMSSVRGSPSPHSPRASSAARNKFGPEAHFARSEALKLPRASIAVGSGQSLLPAAMTRGRPGSEGDELVDVLRRSGFEVAVIRQVSHLPGVISRKDAASNSPLASSSNTMTRPPMQQVVLVPLGDTPSLPSLSLLLAQGTTPTAVCFQQDLLDRARRAEDEWVTTAVARIKRVQHLIQEGQDPKQEAQPGHQPIILGYSANGTLSHTAVTSCVAAGASGVVHSPFDSHVPVVLKQLVEAANEGKTSSAVNLSTSPPAPGHHSLSPLNDETRVVLTPTALAMGAEHESEKILGRRWANSRRRVSTGVSLSRVDSGGSDEEIKRRPPTSTDASGQPAGLPSKVAHSLLAAAAPLFDASRRRSVDTGGIALAFHRASKSPPTPKKTKLGEQKSDPINVVAGDHEQEVADGNTTQFAEVLSEMYQQTMSSIDIHMEEYEALAPPLDHAERVRLVGVLRDWDFRPHQLTQAELYHAACLMFEAVLHTEGVAELCIGADQMNQLLFAVRAIYHAPNPYHNYVHAIDVLQATYQFLLGIGVVPPFTFFLELESGKSLWRRPSEAEQPAQGPGTARARKILRPQDVFAILVAAMGHDVGHPGLSNAFMKNAKVPLSVVYDDKSVLENMHCMLIVQLLRKHGFGFLLGPPSRDEAAKYPARAALDSRAFRQVLYSAILATDMSLHFAWIQRLKELAEVTRSGALAEREKLNDEDRIMLSQALIKCADISNPARPIDTSEHWSTVLLDEWTKQASLEEELELPVSVVAGVDARLQAKGQVGFIDLFTEPLFRATADILPELNVFANSCTANRCTWAERLERLEADEVANAALTANLRSAVGAPLPSAEDDRYESLFPLILPPKLVAGAGAGFGEEMPPSPRSPVASAVRSVYRDEVKPSFLAKHVLALTGFDPNHNSRRMSTPEALLVQSRS